MAGNANVGKSVIFNELTGLHQHVGNWPGKTIERAEGTLIHQDREIEIIDLPGIYSLSTYSIEEIVSRDYIALEQPDVIINVVDATALERNLAFTVQLMELEPKMVIAVNQVDMAEKKGIKINYKEITNQLEVPVIPTVAVKGYGLTDLVSAAVSAVTEDKVSPPRYGQKIEAGLDQISEKIVFDMPYPKRWVALKLLEKDEEIENKVYSQDSSIQAIVDQVTEKIEAEHGHNVGSIIASERYALAHSIAVSTTDHVDPEKSIGETIEDAASHPILGYVLMIASILAVFYSIFTFGDWLAGLVDEFFAVVNTIYFNRLGETATTVFIWDAVIDGLIGGMVVAVPYIGPFYLILSVLEDSGYLARIAYLMDSAMHTMGLHGKGFIPVMLGFGCNVPAVLGARIMETERERLICGFVASLVPCAARSIVIMGLVATYVGFEWAMFLYAVDFLLIFILGRMAYKVAPDEPVGLIMEMPGFRVPSINTTATRTWFKMRSFIYEALPIMVAGNFIVQLASVLGILDVFEVFLSPITVNWLGLPAAAGVVLIFGILRKELTLILLGSLAGSMDFSTFLTPVQMMVFAFVVMVYVPCVSTIAALVKEFGYRKATIISLVEVVVAILLGGVLLRVLPFLGL